MEAFIELGNIHVENIIDYINRHGWEAHGFYYGLKIENEKWCIRNGSTYFGLVKDKKLLGMASFSSARVMTCHFEDESVFRKLDFLKAIRKFRPSLIKADLAALQKIKTVLTRVAICEDIKLCQVMHVSSKSFNRDENVHGMVVDASLIPIRDAVQFLLQVEKAFGRNPLTMNQLKDKVDAIENYMYYIDENRIQGQVVIEFQTNEFAQLGGVYTVPSLRGQGIGKRLTSVMTERMLASGLQVNLLVMKENKAAVKVYETLGFEAVHEMGLMPVNTD